MGPIKEIASYNSKNWVVNEEKEAPLLTRMQILALIQ